VGHPAEVCPKDLVARVPLGLSLGAPAKGLGAGVSGFARAFSPGSEDQHHVPLRDGLSQHHGAGGGSAGCGFCARYRDEGLQLRAGAGSVF